MQLIFFCLFIFYFFIFLKSTVKCLYCWHSFFPRKVSSSSSSFSSSVNDHQPQSLTLLSFLVHAGLFLCFHSPPNSDMDDRIFNVCVCDLFCMHIYTHGGPRFRVSSEEPCRVCAEFDSGEISGWAQSLVHNSHPSIWRPRLIMLWLLRVSSLALHH